MQRVPGVNGVGEPAELAERPKGASLGPGLLAASACTCPRGWWPAKQLVRQHLPTPSAGSTSGASSAVTVKAHSVSGNKFNLPRPCVWLVLRRRQPGPLEHDRSLLLVSALCICLSHK